MHLSPKFQQERWHEPNHNSRAMDLGMTSRTERDHQVQDGLAWHTMVDDDGPLVSARSVADAATVVVAFQHLFPEPAKVFLVLPPERVADSTHPMREDLRFTAPAMHRVLLRLPHHMNRSVVSKTTTSTSQP